MPSLRSEFLKKVTADDKISFHQKELLENMKLVFKINHHLFFTHNEGPVIHITLALKTLWCSWLTPMALWRLM